MKVALALAALCLLVGCGSPEGKSPHASPQAAFEASMQAVADADLDALWPLLTQSGREHVERELRHWQRRFRDPEEGVFLREQIRRRLGPVGEDRFEAAAAGSLRDVFRLMMEADPRPARPEQRAVVVDPDGRTVRIRFEAPSGGQAKEVEAIFVKRTGGWFLDSLQL